MQNKIKINSKRLSFDGFIEHTYGIWDNINEIVENNLDPDKSSSIIFILDSLNYLNKLSDKQRIYIQEYFINNLKYSQIAEKYNVNKSSVCRTIKRGLNTLKSDINYDYLNIAMVQKIKQNMSKNSKIYKDKVSSYSKWGNRIGLCQNTLDRIDSEIFTHNIAYSDCSRSIGRHKNYVQQIISGYIKTISLDDLRKLLSLLNLNPVNVLTKEEFDIYNYHFNSGNRRVMRRF